jgi:hypothetical protein
MTALGIEDYTEEQMLDLVRSGYIDGLQNVESPKIESVGKNLFNKNDADNLINRVLGVSGDVFYQAGFTLSHYIKVRENISYSTSRTASRIAFYDSNKNFISDDINKVTYSIPIGCKYIRTHHPTLDIDTFQIEEGTIATAYEPYKSSILSVDATLNRLPNGVADRVYEDNGQVWLEKNVNTTNLTDAKESGSFVLYQDDGTLETGIVDGSYTTTDAGDIYYELATPELINLTEQGLTSGELMSFENGTVYNSSDTFHSPNLSFDVVTDRNVQLDAKVDQTEFDAHKADNAAHSDLVLNNEVTNGDFSDGATGWRAFSSSTLTALDNILISTGTGGQYCGAYQDIGNQNSEKVFVYIKYRDVSGGSGNFILVIEGSGLDISLQNASLVQNEWYESYGILDLSSFTSNVVLRPRIYYDDATGKVMEIDGNAGVFAINMTALGIEDYTEAEMLKIVQTVGYFEGEYKMTRKEAFDVTMALIAENRAAIIALGGSI